MSSDIVAADNLDTLAQRIRTACEEIQDSRVTALRAVLRAGDDLRAAKTQVLPGTWVRWLQDHCFLGVRTAQVYIQLAKHREQIERELDRGADLSLRDARRLIMKPANKPDAESNEGDGSSSKPDAVSQLLPSWQTASGTQRSAFLKAIGLSALIKAMPPEMLNEIEQRGLGSLELRAKTKKARTVLKKLRKPITIEGKATEIPAKPPTTIEGTATEILAS
jgi:hypothetical protein